MTTARFLVGMALAGCLAGYLAGCTQGATPDCSTTRCGPDLDGTVPDAPSDSPATDAGDAADAGSDAPASDAPSDG